MPQVVYARRFCVVRPRRGENKAIEAARTIDAGLVVIQDHRSIDDNRSVEPAESLESTTPGLVRVGDTVRRPYGPWVPTVTALLRHLQGHDFPSPWPLGLDDEGREVITWLPGVSSWDQHASHWGPLDRLQAAAGLIRRLHDVLDLFEVPKDAVWRGGWGRPEHGPICHNDLAPYNFVVDESGAIGIIDWDGAGFGNRMAEVSYSIDGFVPLRRDDFCERLGYREPPDRPGRIEAFVTAYGLGDASRPVLAEALVHNAHDRAAFGVAMHEQGREPWASWWAEDCGAGDRADIAVTERAVEEWMRHGHSV